VTTFNESLRANTRVVPLHEHDFNEISGELVVSDAQINTLTVSKLTGGTITTTTITVAGTIESSNYVAGTSGWHIDNSGTAEFSTAIIRGQIITESGSDLDGQFLQSQSIVAGAILNATITATQISGTANITGGQIAVATITGANIGALTVEASNIANATITTTQISGSAAITGSQIASATIVAGNIVSGTITATQIQNLTITAGEIANLTITNGQISNTAGITAGKLNVTSLDAITATMGTLTVNSILTMVSGGIIRTAASGQRVELSQANFGEVTLFSGSVNEDFPGSLEIDSGVTMRLRGPLDTSTLSSALITMFSDGTLNISAGSSKRLTVGGATGHQLVMPLGTVAIPSLAFTSRFSTGLASLATDQMAIVTGGAAGSVFGKTSASVPGLSITSASTGDILVKFNTSRAWQFQQLNTGATTRLQLKALSAGKAFDIVEPTGGNNVFTVIAGDLGIGQVKVPVGTVSVPGLAFQGAIGVGIYRPAANEFAIGIASTQELFLSTTLFKVKNVYDVTSGVAANVIVNSVGTLHRSTSSSRYKEDIRPATKSGVLNLTPISFYPMVGNLKRGVALKRVGTRKLFGLTYEDVAKQFSIARQDNDGIDWNAIVTGLLAEIQKLRLEVDEMKVAA